VAKKGKLPFMKFYASDWLSSQDVSTMTLEEEGAYIRLLCHQWRSDDCTIPGSKEKLKLLLKGADPDKFRGVLEKFPSFEVARNTSGARRLVRRNKRLYEEWLEAKEYSRAMAEIGKKGGEASAQAKAKAKGLPCHSSEVRSQISESIEQKSDSIVEPGRSTTQKSPKEKEIAAVAKEILSTFSEKSGRKFRGAAHLEAIRGRLRDGNTREEVLQALENGLRRDDLKDHWRVPSSLLRPSNFEKNLYYGQKLSTAKETDEDVARETGLHVVKGDGK
jgi:uncharacterized protein YdaU (DUF1376 family)